MEESSGSAQLQAPNGNKFGKEDHLHIHAPSQAQHQPIDWQNSSECLNALSSIATISIESWSSRPHLSMELSLHEAPNSTKELLEGAMHCFFTNESPLLDYFAKWVENEMMTKRIWPLKMVKFVGKNLFMILFDNRAHRDQALAIAP